MRQETLTKPTDRPVQPAVLSEAGFLRKLVLHLTGTLEDVVGLHEAGGFIATAAQRIGEQLNELYRRALCLDKLDRRQVCDLVLEIERSLNGNTRIVHEDETRIVFEGCLCPFGEEVMDRPSMCTLLTNILGVIAAENLGYAKVSVEESLARGDARCRIVIYLQYDEGSTAAGREYFQSQ